MSSDDLSDLSDLIADVAKSHSEPRPGELPGCWPVLVDLGLPLVGIDESRGGSGGSLEDLMVLVRALGRHAISAPLIENAVANWVLAHRGEVRPELRTIALDGHRSIPWARHATQVVSYADGAASVAEVGGVRPGVNIAGEPADLVEPAAATPVESAPSADAVRARLGALWSAALTGAVAGAYELTRTYVRTRHQFGKPLIQIPAVATNLATIKTALLQCEAALARAADGGLVTAAAARVVTSRAATDTARIAHQLHGAMGITAEYPLHRFTKRLWAWRDAGTTAHEWSLLLGERALSGGEETLWTELTA